MNATSELLTTLFSRLNEEKIKYCILRNYEELPEWVGNDVDIWVEKKDWEKFHYVVKEVANILNYTLNYTPRLTIKGEGDYFLSKFIDGRLNTIHIDSWAYLHWRGLCFVDESVIGKHLKWNEKGFYVLLPGVEASINLLKDLIYHGKVKEKYKDKIKEFLLKDSTTFLECLQKPFGRKISFFIFEHAQKGNWQILEENYKKLRIILFLKSSLHPISQPIKFFYYFRAQIRRFFTNPHGLFIVLIGPDGSGKSTTANNLIESEIKTLFQKKHYFHGHFPYLPEMKKILSFFGLHKGSSVSSENPRAIHPFGTLRSILYPVYYGFNYFLGHFFIWQVKAKAGLIIFDRYFYDYFIQKQFINCPKWLLNLIEKLIPKPDIIIYLKNNPEVIHVRKSELTIEEIKRQSLICEEITRRHPQNSVIIETTTPEEVILNIQRIIINKIKERQTVTQ